MAGNPGWAWKPSSKDLERMGTAFLSRADRKKKERKRKRKAKRDVCYARGDRFYLSKKWLKMRIKVFATYGRKCMKCDRKDGEMHVDHVVPRSKRPDLSLSFSNLQVLCRDCNMEKWNYNCNDYREESATRDLDLEMLASLPAKF